MPWMAMTLCVVAGSEDLVFVVEEECRECTNRKLDVLKRYPLSTDKTERQQEINDFRKMAYWPIEGPKKAWNASERERVEKARLEGTPAPMKPPVFPEFLWSQPRLVKVKCDC